MKRNILTVVLTTLSALTLSLSTAHAQDAVKVSPTTNKILFENDHVRVVQSTFEPGAKEGVHTHPAGFYYVTQAGKLKVTHADGKVEMWEPKPGDTEWSDGEGAHSAENVGTTTLQYVLLEVKSAPAKTPAPN